MSGKLSSVGMFIFLVAILVAANRAEELGSAQNSKRGPAAFSKEAMLGSMEKPLLRHTHKLRGPVEATIELSGARPEAAGDVFVLRGFISSSESLQDVKFKWTLPKGVEVVNGEVKGAIASLSGGKPHEVQLTLKSLTGENHQVHLLAGASNGGARFADTAQYNTLLQEVLEVSRKELRKSTKESAAEATKAPRLKVFH